jgi:hypothetical protein
LLMSWIIFLLNYFLLGWVMLQETQTKHVMFKLTAAIQYPMNKEVRENVQQMISISISMHYRKMMSFPEWSFSPACILPHNCQSNSCGTKGYLTVRRVDD